jgi:hypothetical protein
MTLVLGHEMMSRGKDATGILTVDRKGRWKLRKKPQPANVFFASKQGIGCSAASLLLHTRAATQGKPEIAGNNHPIQYENIIGIHNGILYNDYDLYDHFKWERKAQVDSEAIFAALHHLPMVEALENIDGGWATAWVDVKGDPRIIWLARGDSNPLHYAMTNNGSVVFASTPFAVKEAFKVGGITGDPVVNAAPEGWLACTDPDGGLTVLPQFDGSGEKAIGHRKKVVWTGTYNGGTGWEGTGGYNPYQPHKKANANVARTAAERAALPTPFTRIQITGIKASPKVGDTRKFIDDKGEWIYEECSATSPPTWAQCPAWKQENAKLSLPSGGVVIERVTTPKEPDKAVVLPFDRDTDDERDSERYGNAEIGDLICIPRKLFGATFPGSDYGGIIGIVRDIDPLTERLTVDWRPSRLDKWDEYEVLIKAANVDEAFAIKEGVEA